MKIIEIISMERVEPINEDIKSALLGGSARLAAKAFAKSDKTKAIEHIAANYVDKSTGKLFTNLPQNISQWISAVEQKFGKVNSNGQPVGTIVKAAESLAKSTAKKEETSAAFSLLSSKWHDIKSTTSEIYSFGKWIATAASTIWLWDVILTPYLVYIDEIKRGEEAVEKHEPNWTPEYFEQYRKQRTSLLIGKIVSQLIIKKLTFGVLSKVPIINNVVKGGLLPAAEAYFMDKVNSPEGCNAIATIMLSSGISGVIGGGVTTAIDTIKGYFNDAKSKESGQITTDVKPTTSSDSGNSNGESPESPIDQSKYAKSWDY